MLIMLVNIKPIIHNFDIPNLKKIIKKGNKRRVVVAINSVIKILQNFAVREFYDLPSYTVKFPTHCLLLCPQKL